MSPDPLDATSQSPVIGKPSFSLQNRIARAIWNVTWALLAAWTPPPLHRWRRLLLVAFGARIAPTARVYGSARIWYPGNLVMGVHSVLGPRTICYSQGRIAIGDFACVSQNVHLCAGTHDVDDPFFQLIPKPITIQNHAWIAADAFVGPGVTVGEGAVLGARGVTAKDLEPWTIYAGNPARMLRLRRRLDGDREALIDPRLGSR